MSANGDWELSKENIQPLSSGRRIAFLEESLPTASGTAVTDQQYEAYHLEEIRKLEEIATEQRGDDPLQTWVDLINYVQQHFPSQNAKIAAVYARIIKQATEIHYGYERYHNDRRYIEILLAFFSTQSLPPSVQIGGLQSFIKNNVGNKISSMYMKIAEIYISEGDEKRALEILRNGVVSNAEPVYLLEEMITYVQDLWGAKFAKQLKEGVAPTGVSNSERRFATAVPTVGEQNEAISIRRDLNPAAPFNTGPPLPQRFQPAVPIFVNENVEPAEVAEGSSTSQSVVAPVNLRSSDREQEDRENRLEPSRWNNDSTQLHQPVIPEPPPKFQLYAEPNDNPSNSRHQTQAVDNKHVLKELKLKDDSELGCNNIVLQNTVKELVGSEPKDSSKLIPPVPEQGRSSRMDFSENIKYKPLPPGGKVNRIMMKAKKWRLENERRNQEDIQLSAVIKELQTREKGLVAKIDLLEEKLKDQQILFELKLTQKDEKINELETVNEESVRRLTEVATNNNLLETHFLRETRRIEMEKDELQQQLERKLEAEKELVLQLELYKRQYARVVQEKSNAQVSDVIRDSESESDVISVERMCAVVDVDVYNIKTESLSYTPDQNSVCNSFLPNLEAEKSVFRSENEKRALAEHHVENGEINNIPPATTATSIDMGMPAPSLSSFSFRKPMPRTFSLYESMSESFGKQNLAPNTNPTATTKRLDAVKNLKALSENLPPPDIPVVGENYDENNATPQLELPQSVPHVTGVDPSQGSSGGFDDIFRRPELHLPGIPSATESESAPNYILGHSRRSVGRRPSLSSRLLAGGVNSDDEEEDIIVRRHQQTGVDLNMSNLTCVLALGPKPLTNSTPEKMPRENPQFSVQQAEGGPITDSQAFNYNARMSRYNSILNDPQLNLSAIQETSREYRSRSTTGSSSGNMTASSTRFGMATMTGTTHINTTRSISVPRSTSQSQVQYNGYYSDTGGK